MGAAGTEDIARRSDCSTRPSACRSVTSSPSSASSIVSTATPRSTRPPSSSRWAARIALGLPLRQAALVLVHAADAGETARGDLGEVGPVEATPPDRHAGFEKAIAAPRHGRAPPAPPAGSRWPASRGAARRRARRDARATPWRRARRRRTARPGQRPRSRPAALRRVAHWPRPRYSGTGAVPTPLPHHIRDIRRAVKPAL